MDKTSSGMGIDFTNAKLLSISINILYRNDGEESFKLFSAVERYLCFVGMPAISVSRVFSG